LRAWRYALPRLLDKNFLCGPHGDLRPDMSPVLRLDLVQTIRQVFKDLEPFGRAGAVMKGGSLEGPVKNDYDIG
jgi:hypothetical protein